MKVRKGKEGIDAGLRESARTLAPGETRTCEELAAFCHVHRRTIEKIEASGIRKLRHRLAPIWKELYGWSPAVEKHTQWADNFRHLDKELL